MTQLFPTPTMGGLWSLYDPSHYVWTTPQNGGWFAWISNSANNAQAMIASFVSMMDAMFLRIAIWAVQGLSDPSWLFNKLAQHMDGIMSGAYSNIFIRFMPILFAAAAAMVVYRYALGHHAKMWQNIMSTFLASVLVITFFSNFGMVFKTVNNFGEFVTNTAGTAVAAVAGTNFGSEYDAVWDAYILYPWVYGQFGNINQNYNQNTVNGMPPALNVGPNAIGQTYTDSANNTYMIQNGQNWATLFLTHSDPAARKNLMAILDKNPSGEFVGQTQSVATAINPGFNWILAIVDGIFMLLAVAFLGMIAFQLFTREIMFMLMILMGMFTVPMAFIPEIGWTITLKWVKEGVGHLLHRAAIMIYAVLVMAIAGIVAQISMEQGVILLAPIVNGLIFLAAIMYKNKVFASLAHAPISKFVHGSGTQNAQGQDTRSAEHQAQRSGNTGNNPAYEAEHAGNSGGRKLQDVFSHSDNAGQAINRPKGKSHLVRDLEIAGTAAATVADGGATAPLLAEEIGGAVATEGAEVAASKAATSAATKGAEHVAQSRAAQSGTKTLTDRAKDFASQKAKQHGQAMLNRGTDALKDHVKNALDPNARPSTWHQRAAKRESFARGLEHSAHKLAVRSLHSGGRFASKTAVNFVKDSVATSRKQKANKEAKAAAKRVQALAEAEREKLSTAMTNSNTAYSIPRASLDSTSKIQEKLSSIGATKRAGQLGMDAATLADWDTYAKQLTDADITNADSARYVPTPYSPDVLDSSSIAPTMTLDDDVKAALASAYQTIPLTAPPTPPKNDDPSQLTDATRAAINSAYNNQRQPSNRGGTVPNINDDNNDRLGGTMSDRFSVMDGDNATISRPEIQRSEAKNDQSLDTTNDQNDDTNSDQTLPTQDSIQTASNAVNTSKNDNVAQAIVDAQNATQNSVNGSAATDQVIVVRRDADGNAVGITATAPTVAADSNLTTPAQLAQNVINQQPNVAPQPIPSAPEQSNVTFINQYRDNATSHGDQPTHNVQVENANEKVQEKREQARAKRAQTVREESDGYVVGASSKAAPKRSGTAATRKAATTKSANARKKEQQAKRRTTPGRKQD